MPVFDCVDEESVKELICVVCLNPFLDPVEVVPCRHIFCRGCVGDRLVRCHMCRGTVEKTVTPNRILINMAAEVVMRCVDCDWTGPNHKKREHRQCTNRKRDAVASAAAGASRSVTPPPVHPGRSRSTTPPPPGEVFPPLPTHNLPRVRMLPAPFKPRAHAVPAEQQRPPTPPPQLGREPWRYYNMTQQDFDHCLSLMMCFDVTKQGTLTRGELEALAKYLNFAQAPADLDKMWAEMDPYKTGFVDLHRFCLWLSRHRPDPQALYGLNPMEYHEVLFLFHESDTQNRGVLDAASFQNLAIKMGFSRNAREAQELFRAIDTEHTGFCDLHGLLLYIAHRKHEYQAMIQRYQQQRQQFQQDVRRVSPNARAEVYQRERMELLRRVQHQGHRVTRDDSDNARRPQRQNNSNVNQGDDDSGPCATQ